MENYEKNERIKFTCLVALPMCYVAAGVIIITLWGDIAFKVLEMIDFIGRAI